MRFQELAAALLAGALFLTAGCAARGNQDYRLGRKAQDLQDYDTALVDYERALRADPTNTEYKLRVDEMRFTAAQDHVEQGQRLMAKGDLNDVEAALGLFQRALDINPASAIAAQMSRRAMARINELKKASAPPSPQAPAAIEDLLRMPPQLKPISTQPINLKMTNDARIVYQTIAKLAGLTVLFDPDFAAKRISIDLPNVTLQQALDAVSLESDSFWKPVTPAIIFVAPDNVQKRREYADEIIKTFYLKNTLTPQDLTEIVGGLRQLLQLQRVQQINSQNAIVIRDTPDKVLAAEKIINDIDKQRAEVMLQVSVLEVNENRLRDLGIRPGTSVTATFTPRSAIQPGSSSSSSSSSSSVPQVTLNNLAHLSSSDYAVTLPGAALTALMTDSDTKIIQNPEVRITDGEIAHLRIGDRVPIATGSFQAGLGTTQVGAVSPLVNTQFQYQDVGVNIDVTPVVHPDKDISLNLDIEVSSVTGQQSIGGIEEPIISQRKVQTQIRLANGEVSVLGGLVQHTTTKTVNGWPGLDKLPFLKYFFSDQSLQKQDDEVLVVLTPHVVRMPDMTAENLQSLFTGTDQNVEVYPRTEFPGGQRTDGSASAPVIPAPGAAASGAAGASSAPGPAAASAGGTLAFSPASVNLTPGQTTTVALVVRNASDLFSIPMILHYNPKIVSIEDVRNGGFLSGGTKTVAIFHHEDAVKGQSIISVMRQPNTNGVSGSGTLVGIVVKALAPGVSPLEIESVNAQNPRQKPLSFQTQSATIRVGNPR